MTQASTLPNSVGISLKPQHYQDILANRPDIAWFEVHPENYMGAGGLPHQYLAEIHQHYPLSMHGVGMSLGSAEGIDQHHLEALVTVVERHQPEQVSEHLAWSHWNQHYFNDLLPIPYTQEFLGIVVDNIHRVQDALKRTILIENPSIYLGFEGAGFEGTGFEGTGFTETDFLKALVKQTDCGLLLDVNNIFVSANNQQFSAEDYLANYPIAAVGEIHLAGHSEDQELLIDDHGSRVCASVWNLFEQTLSQLGSAVPVLIEWDTNVPDLSILIDEANQAKQLLNTSEPLNKSLQ